MIFATEKTHYNIATHGSYVTRASKGVLKIARAIQAVVRSVFEMMHNLLFFPLRHIGAKNWSVPGVVLRMPWIVIKKCFGQSSKSLSQEALPNHYRNYFEKTLTTQEFKQYYPHVCATAFVHQNKEQFIPQGWRKLSMIDLDIKMPQVETLQSCLFSARTGFKVSCIENEKTKEIIVIFGSLEVNGGETKKKIPFFKTGVVIQSILGVIPKTVEQADHAAKILLEHPYFQNKKIVFTGNSYGATLAQYAGLRHQRPAVCFNAFALGVGPQYKIGQKRLQEADQYITHISAEGDYATDLSMYRPLDNIISCIGLKTLGNFGHRYKIPSAYAKLCEIHGYILGSAMQHLGHNIRTSPRDILN